MKTNELKEAILNTITTFANWEDYKQDYETVEEAQEDFNAELEDNTIQNITLSTYNGASNETTYHELTEQTILDSILTDIRDLDLYNTLADYRETILDEPEATTDLDYILAYVEFYKVFILNGLLYVERL